MTKASDKISLKEQVAQLPLLPGCYLFSNSDGEVIYVGKAKNLRRRVSSYFVERSDHTPKVRVMVRHIASLRYVTVDSESDALLLENSLIKSLQPRYNILLKDDKSYPWIVVRNEPFPRIESVRQLVRDGSQYFGPYGSVAAQRAMLEFLKGALPLRTCRLALTEEGVLQGRFRSCLQQQLGNCKAPCIGCQSSEEYAAVVDMAISALKGNLRDVRAYLEREMSKAAADLRFEEAQRLKTRLEALDNYSARSVIVSPTIGDMDVFGLYVEGDEAYCTFVRVVEGAVTAIQTVMLRAGVESDDATLLTFAINHICENVIVGGELAREVLVSTMPDTALFGNVHFMVPQRGEKHKLVEFALRSARLFRAERLKNLAIKNPERHTAQLMAAMQRELRLPREPHHIECFDNSNLQGTNPVASCVVFRDGRPSKSEYRHFNIKSVVGADDFASMREILLRRYSRLLSEGQPLPDLIVVDGGKGQLSSAYGVLCELGIEKDVPIIGLAKRLEEVFYPNDSMPYYLSRTGEPLRVICHIRDEAHRFGITHHRNRRSKSFIHSELDDIAGIGQRSIEQLIKRFRTVAAVAVASREELAAVVGDSRAVKIRQYFDTKR